MTLTNLKIRDLITPEEKLTFLVGAGCSVDAPSCLPMGRQMIEAIIKFACAESDIQKILGLEDLRFERLVEIVRDHLDDELKIIDYYGQCDRPNFQHFYLTEMIKRGNFVMTTNFDFLIEYALQQSGVPNEKILPVITREDFEKYDNPNRIFKQGKKAIYKVHGSTKNIISGESTKDSLVATVQAFGSNKEGGSIFQVEPFKRTLFENISNGRSLVVIGYSGSDDFDIIPTLMLLKNVQNVIWINFSLKNTMGDEQIFEIDMYTSQTLDQLDNNSRKVTQILLEVWEGNNANHIYRVDVNTSDMVKNLIESRPTLSLKDFPIKARDWLENNISAPNEMMKYYIASKIYFDFDLYNDVLVCSKKILRLARNSNNKYWESSALNNIGMICTAQGNYPAALERYEEALKIEEQVGNTIRKATRLNNIGGIYNAQGNYHMALKRYEEALKIDEYLGNLSGKATRLNNIASIQYVLGNYHKALKLFEEVLQIDKQLGDLSGRSTRLNNIGKIYEVQGNYSEALKQYNKSLQIDEKLGNLKGKASRLNNIGKIYRIQGNYPKALKLYEEALQIDEQLEDLDGKSTSLNNIGLIYDIQGNHQKALTLYEEVFQIVEQLGDLSKKSTCLNNIGMIYYAQGNYPEALKRYELKLKIDEKLGDLSGKATVLTNIASLHVEKGIYPKALKIYEEALQINDQLGNLNGKAYILNNIGAVYYHQGNYPEALRRFEEALVIFTRIGLGNSPNARALNNSIEVTRSKLI